MLQTGLLGYCKIHGFWILYDSKTAGGEGRREPVWWVMGNASITTKKLLPAPLAKQRVTELSRISGWGFWMRAKYTFPLEEWSSFGLITFVAINDDNEQLCSVVAACNFFAISTPRTNRCIIKWAAETDQNSEQVVQLHATVQPSLKEILIFWLA